MRFIIYQYLDSSNRWLEIGASCCCYIADSFVNEMKRRFPDKIFKLECEII